MKENFGNEQWKEDLERGAEEAVPKPSEEEIDKVFHNAAAQMGDEESLDIASHATPEMIREIDLKGWHYLGPATPELMYKAIMEDHKEIRVIRMGMFEKEKEEEK